MALVAYDNSDSSDYEENYNETVPIIINNKNEDKGIEPQQKESKKLNTQDTYWTKQDIDQQSTQNLFNHLPQPTSQKVSVIEEDDEFLYKKENTPDIKPKSKITVPSLSDFKDVKDTIPSARPKISNGKKSGLLSILPQPKHLSTSTITSKSLIPLVVTQKPHSSTAKKKDSLPLHSKKTKLETKITGNPISQYSDDSDDDVQNDFFSINKPEIPLEELPLDVELPTSSKVRDNPLPTPRSLESYFKHETVDNHADEVHDNVEMGNMMYSADGSGQINDDIAPSESGEIALDEEAILKLCGSRGKRKREDIQIVDVNQQEVLADAREWLLKGLMDDTSKRVSASKKRGNEPTSQQKRKHQITYLAHQAKANEIELQNQWANNRMTKRQTQSKYGF